MRRRRLCAVLVLLLVALPAAGGQAQDGGVQQLWKEYPLQDGTPAPSPSAKPEATGAASTPRRPAAGEDSDPPVELIAVGGGLLLFLLAGTLVVITTRRRTGPAAPEPAAAVKEPTWVEGDTIRGEPGAFSGPIAYDGADLVLVQDPDRGPVWVRRTEMRRSRPRPPARAG